MRRSLRFLTNLTVGALTLTGLLGIAASGAAAQTISIPAAEQAATQRLPADVDDFTFASLRADYRLDRDDEGHSTLATTETLTAEFPEVDQNHGIRRNIPPTIGANRPGSPSTRSPTKTA